MTAELDSVWWLGPEIRSAAETLALDWPEVTTADELTADLTLYILDHGQAEEIEYMPVDRRANRVKILARDLVHKVVAEHEFYSGNVLYSVSSVRNLLESGALDGPRLQFKPENADLAEGCRYLAQTHPHYASAIGARYILDQTVVEPGFLSRAIGALTTAMNHTNRHRPENRVRK